MKIRIEKDDPLDELDPFKVKAVSIVKQFEEHANIKISSDQKEILVEILSEELSAEWENGYTQGTKEFKDEGDGEEEE
jgi:nucleosome binding factor SPN SPT16 subunit